VQEGEYKIGKFEKEKTMKKKLLCLLLAIVMTFGCIAVLTACGGEEDDPPVCEDHVDDNGDGKCDVCQAVLQEDCECVDEDGDGYCDICGDAYSAAEEVINYPWTSQTLIFQFTENDNELELSSGCHRYLAGDDGQYTQAIDTSIDARNRKAERDTKITVTYAYWPNTENYTWGACIKQIESIVTSNTIRNAPDVYCNFIYDIVGSAVKGYFANLKGKTRGVGELAGLNYFKFNEAGYDESVDNAGYMNEWMNSVTLSKHKTYVLGSDYFTDMIRAFFIIPVSVQMLEDYGDDDSLTGDWNEDGEFTIDDFYAQVKDGYWTYDLMMDYSDAVYSDDGEGDTVGTWLGDDQVGFAMSAGGVAVSGLLYTSTVEVIKKEFNNDTNDYDYWYPDDNEELGAWDAAAEELLSANGVAYVSYGKKGYEIDEWGSSHLTAIRKRFSTGNVLFGDIMMIGALEYQEYQDMRDGKGFGVVPVPLYDIDAGWTAEAPYLTQIHNVGRPGAIAKNTTKFVECTAFLNYQSTHSTEILNQYYDYELTYGAVGGAAGTVEMLKYIRKNVRTSFDKAMEDAIGVFKGESARPAAVTQLIALGNASAQDVRTAYKGVLPEKRGYLNDLLTWFEEAQN